MVNMKVGQIVSFLYLKNKRGYPLTGQVKEIVDEKHVHVTTFGLRGPGSTLDVTDVPITDLREESFRLDTNTGDELP